MTNETQITHDNHYVPCMALKRFADTSGKIWRYRIFVSHHKVEPWRQSNIRGVAFQKDLYTRVAFGTETDEIERWFNRSFEIPAEESLEKVTQNKELTSSDWDQLVRFLAAQCVRTPAFLKKHLGIWNDGVPPHWNKADVREQWFTPMRMLLTQTLEILHHHKWSILIAPEESEWFTSDDPVITLNYHSEREYDFNGGWGSDRTEILLPLSPRHLLYTMVGNLTFRSCSVVPESEACNIRRIIAEHAHRFILCSSRDPE